MLCHHVLEDGHNIVFRYRRPRHTKNTVKFVVNEGTPGLLSGFSKYLVFHFDASNLGGERDTCRGREGGGRGGREGEVGRE